ncbi:MAG: molybdenum ABC transporter ATP-binding protein [Betaproteobacteria bacterium]|nr:MAG: molybdenum ABC transporter ATP-binding protein [Betaproteobacteria bacterium]
MSTASEGLHARLRLARGGFTLEVEFATAAHGVSALFGASGSGKTSVLRCIAGLTRAQEGFVSLGDECWQDEARGRFVPAHLRSCGYVFQESSLFAHLSVRHNLEYGWKRVPSSARRVVFDDTVELLGIGPLLARRPATLSGGERQRVAMARALLASPSLLLMDEPLASLDEARKGEILYYVERLRDELRLPIVYVSHSIDEVVRLADAVIMISHGRVVDIGPVSGRLEGGSVIDTRVAEQDLAWGIARLEFSGGSFYAPDVDALPGERVRVRIRARDVSLSLAPPRDASFLNVLAGTVAAISDEPGASADVQLDVAGTLLIARVTRKSIAALGLAPGRRAYALIKSVAIDRTSVGYA